MLELISNSEISRLLRHSIWLYPLVNTGHIIGFALLLGAIVPMDLRLLGYWSTVPVVLLSRVLVPVAVYGLVISLVCGVLLFISRPDDYINSTLFLSKLSLIVVGLLNATSLLVSSDWRIALRSNAVSQRVKLHSALSVILWLSVIVSGRLIGYR